MKNIFLLWAFSPDEWAFSPDEWAFSPDGYFYYDFNGLSNIYQDFSDK
jgi:hypothetical protein